MRLAVISHHAPDDMKAFSGIPFHMFRALEAATDVRRYIQIPPFDLHAALAGSRSSWRQLQALGAAASQALSSVDADVILCLGGAAAPYLESRMPIVHWHDSTWHALLRMPTADFTHRHALLREWDQRTLDRSSLVLYAADWVRDDALLAYGADPSKIHVLPFGANVPDPGQAEVTRSIIRRRGAPVQLTFVGADWRRKGLRLAQLLTTRLNRCGVEAELAAVGPDFDGMHFTGKWKGDGGELEVTDIRSDPSIRLLGFVDKQSTAARQAYSDLLLRSDYLVHPAHFECFGIVLAEAAAHGLPVLALDAYGPRDVVRPGQTGHLFPPHDFVERACDVVLADRDNPDAYHTVALAARREYELKLNWTSAVRQFLELILQRGLLPRPRPD